MAAAFSLYISTDRRPSLVRTHFLSPISHIPIICNRGNWLEPESNHTFKWSLGVRGLAELFLQTKVEFFRSESSRSLPLLGRNGSPIAILDYAISKGPDWITRMFGEDQQGLPLYRKIFKRTNPERKRGGDVSIWLNPNLIPPSSITVYLDDEQMTDPAYISILSASLIEEETEPRFAITSQTIRITGGKSKTQQKSYPVGLTNRLIEPTVSAHCPFDEQVSWLTRIVAQDLQQALWRLDVFDARLFGSKLERVLGSGAFRQKLRSKLRYYLDPIFLNKQILVQLSIEEALKLGRGMPSLRVATSPSHTGSIAIVKHLINHGLSLNLDITAPNTLSLLKTGGQGMDALVVALPTMQFFAESALFAEYVPIMAMPPVSHALLVNNTTELGEKAFKSGIYLLRGPDTCFVDSLCSARVVAKNRITIIHKNEISDIIPELLEDGKRSRVPLPFPYFDYFARFLNFTTLKAPVEQQF